MLLFGSIVSGNGAGTNFWQFSPTENPLIDIDQSTGATGLAVTTPNQENLLLLTDDLFGSGDKAGMFIDNSNNQFSLIGTINNQPSGGDVGSGMVSFGNTAQITIRTYTQAFEGLKLFVKAQGGNVFAGRTNDTQSITEEASDDNLNASQHNQNPNIHAFRFFNPTNGAQKAAYEMDETETRVKDGAGIKTFAVLKDGSLQTNQAQPHNNTINTLTWDLPIYDTSGTLLGYIKVFT